MLTTKIYLAGVAMKRKNIYLNQPLYVGFAILEISKYLMYLFHYKWALKKYGSSLKLCMTDTDSFLYQINTKDVYEDIKKDLHLFDTSGYPPEHPCYSPLNHKKLGTFKDEYNSRPIHEFVGLRSKCYSVLENSPKEKKVAKGVPRIAIKNQLTHKDYKACLFNNTEKLTHALTIRSKLHQIFTQNISKLSLSPFDTKRYVLDCGVKTLAYGHYLIGKRKHESEERFVKKPKL